MDKGRVALRYADAVRYQLVLEDWGDFREHLVQLVGGKDINLPAMAGGQIKHRG